MLIPDWFFRAGVIDVRRAESYISLWITTHLTQSDHVTAPIASDTWGCRLVRSGGSADPGPPTLSGLSGRASR